MASGIATAVAPRNDGVVAFIWAKPPLADVAPRCRSAPALADGFSSSAWRRKMTDCRQNDANGDDDHPAQPDRQIAARVDLGLQLGPNGSDLGLELGPH
jgi:hypothetical protein